uniref:Unannotated protein n=1 Tax=freshwater metagenome TaxID=449393 RepID=A0A6J7M7Z3_9ZZZZ
MARSIPVVPTTTISACFTRRASASGVPGNSLPQHSRSRPIATGDSPRLRRSQLESESFGRRRPSRRATSSTARSGWRSTASSDRPLRATSSRTADECEYTGRPSSPLTVTIASPRTVRPPRVMAMFFSGVPSKRPTKWGDQPVSTPTLDGCRSCTRTPTPRRMVTQPPSEPTRGHEAPPSASTVMSASSSCTVPLARKKRRVWDDDAEGAVSAQPLQR